MQVRESPTPSYGLSAMCLTLPQLERSVLTHDKDIGRVAGGKSSRATSTNVKTLRIWLLVLLALLLPIRGAVAAGMLCEAGGGLHHGLERPPRSS